MNRPTRTFSRTFFAEAPCSRGHIIIVASTWGRASYLDQRVSSLVAAAGQWPDVKQGATVCVSAQGVTAAPTSKWAKKGAPL